METRIFEHFNLLSDTYDALVIAGGMGEGHIPVGAIDEFIRIVRPGTELNIYLQLFQYLV